MKVSRVVIIVVALHVLVIGGIFVFEGCSRARKAPDLAANESLPGDTNTLATAQPLGPDSLPGLTPATPSAAPAVAAPAPAAQPTSRTYTVKKGDSLWKIAKSEHVGMAELAHANNLTKTSTLQVGQKLQIPVRAETAPTAVATAASAPAAASPTAAPAAEPVAQAYTVKPGDSLWKIARANNLTVASIKQANNLKTDTLKVGQKLRIPAPAPAPTATASAGTAAWSGAESYREPGTYQENGQVVHVVESGETPATIARKYGVKTDDLMRANNITDPRRLSFGQKLVIPTTNATTATAQPAAAEPAPGVQPALAAPIVSATQ